MKTKKNFLKKLTAGILGFVMTLGVGAAGYAGAAAESRATDVTNMVYTLGSTMPNGWTDNSSTAAASGYLKMMSGEDVICSRTTLIPTGNVLTSDMDITISCGTFGTWKGTKSTTVTYALLDSSNSVLSSTSGTYTGLDNKEGTYKTKETISKPSNPSSIAQLKISFSIPNAADVLRFKYVKLSYSYGAGATTYTLNFNAGTGGSGTQTGNPMTSTTSPTFTLPECTFTAPANKLFDGWGTSNSSDSKISDTTYTITSGTSATLYALWKDKPATGYTINFDGNNNGAGGSQSPLFNENEASFTLPTTTGFTAPTDKEFIGWSETAGTSGSGGTVITSNPYTPTISAGGSKTLYACWRAIEYQDLPENFSTTITIDYAGTTSDPVVDASYVLKEKTGSTYYKKATATYNDGVTRNYANEYTWKKGASGVMTLKSNSNALITKITVNYYNTNRLVVKDSSDIILTGSGSNSAFVYEKINSDTVTFNVNTSNDTSVYSMTVEFKVPLKFSVTFVKNVTGTINNWPDNVSNVSSYSIPSTAPTLTGYNFKHYNTAANDSGTSYEPGDVISSTLTLYGIWHQTYTVTLNAGKGSGNPVVLDGRYETLESAPACPTSFTTPSEGKVFDHWSTSNITDSRAEFPLELNSNTILYAIWKKPNGYVKVTAAPVDSTGTVDWSGSYLLVYESSASSAYVWDGMASTENGVATNITTSGGKSIIASIPENAVSITIAKYSTGYSIQVNDPTGEYNNGKYIYGSSGSNALNFSDNEQLITLSYDSTNKCKIVSNTSVMRFNSNSDQQAFKFFKSTTYTGQKAIELYKLDNGPSKYTVTFDPKGGSFGTGVQYEYEVEEGNSVTLLTSSQISKTGYTFDGWSLTEGGSKLSGSTYTPEDDTTLYARWNVNQYDVDVIDMSSDDSNVTFTGTTGPNAVSYGTDYEAELTFYNGAVLEGIAITIGDGDDISEEVYNNGIISIDGEDILGDIVIMYQAEVPEEYSITNNLTYITNNNEATTVEAESSYNAILAVKDAFFEFVSVKVEMNNVDITSTAYKSSTHEISIDSVIGDVVITASGRFTGTVTLNDATKYEGYSDDPSFNRSVASTTGFTGTLSYLWTTTDDTIAKPSTGTYQKQEALIQLADSKGGTARITVTVTDGVDGHSASASFDVELTKSSIKSIETDKNSLYLSNNEPSDTIKCSITKVGNISDQIEVSFDSSYIDVKADGVSISTNDVIENNTVLTVSMKGAYASTNITFKANAAKSNSVVVPVTIEKAKTPYYLITDVSQLVPGMKVVLGSKDARNKKDSDSSGENIPTVAGPVNTAGTANTYLTCDQDKSAGTTSYDSENKIFRSSFATEFTLESSGTLWKLKVADDKYLQCNDAKNTGINLTSGTGITSDWSISFDEDSNALVRPNTDTGSSEAIKFNDEYPRFKDYGDSTTTNIKPIQLYAAANSVSSLEVTPTKTEYEVGDTFEFSGSVVASYTGTGSVTNTLSNTQYNVSSVDMSTAGTKEVTISYTYVSPDSGSKTVSDKFNITVTAQAINVIYNANGGSGAPTDSTNYEPGSTVPISSVEPTREDYIFRGWNTMADGTGTSYQPGGTINNIQSSVTLYAQWIDKAVDASGITLGCGLNFKYGIKDGGLEKDENGNPVLGSIKMRFSASMSTAAAEAYGEGYTFGMLLVDKSNLGGETLRNAFKACDYDKNTFKSEYSGKAASWSGLPSINPDTSCYEFGANLSINENDLVTARSQTWVVMWYAINVETGQFVVTGSSEYNLTQVCQDELAKPAITSNIEKEALRFIGGISA